MYTFRVFGFVFSTHLLYTDWSTNAKHHINGADNYCGCTYNDRKSRFFVLISFIWNIESSYRIFERKSTQIKGRARWMNKYGRSLTKTKYDSKKSTVWPMKCVHFSVHDNRKIYKNQKTNQNNHTNFQFKLKKFLHSQFHFFGFRLAFSFENGNGYCFFNDHWNVDFHRTIFLWEKTDLFLKILTQNLINFELKKYFCSICYN